MSVRLRPAEQSDVAWLTALVSHPEVAPFLAAVRAATEAEVAAEVDRSSAEPDAFGVVVITAADVPVGTATWERVNRRSRIASISGVALDPTVQGQGIAQEAVDQLVRALLEEHGFHRVQLEVYGFNERAAALFERVGFVREGVRRQAYWRDGTWVDGICFGLVAEDRV